jgi:iron complex transport system substrate-binding protein
MLCLAMSFCAVASRGTAKHEGGIASLNLCADQLIVEMLPRDRIVGLGPFSRDPSISFVAEDARSLPQITGRGEELSILTADAVLAGPFDNKLAVTRLKRRNQPVVIVERWSDLASASRGIVELADALGVRPEGQRIVDEIDRELAALKRKAAARSGPDSFLVVHRRGYVGHGEILAEILRAAGLRDLAHGSPARFLGSEAILSVGPQILVLVGNDDARMEDRGMELLRHPALRSAYPPSRRLIVPDRLTICAGPATPHLIREIDKQLDGIGVGR